MKSNTTMIASMMPCRWFVWFLYYHARQTGVIHNLVEYAFNHSLDDNNLIQFLTLPETHNISIYWRICWSDERYQYAVYYLLKHCPTFRVALGSYSSQRYHDEICLIMHTYESKLRSTMHQSLKCIMNRDLVSIVVDYT
jgi:hypothetical protein